MLEKNNKWVHIHTLTSRKQLLFACTINAYILKGETPSTNMHDLKQAQDRLAKVDEEMKKGAPIDYYMLLYVCFQLILIFVQVIIYFTFFPCRYVCLQKCKLLVCNEMFLLILLM